MSFRPTEDQRPYLQELAKKRGINNQTELLRTIISDHEASNVDGRSKLDSHVDNSVPMRCRPVVSQKNGERRSSANIAVAHEMLSTARGDRDRVDKPSFKNKQRRRQDPLPMQYREDGVFYVDNSSAQANSMSTGNWNSHQAAPIGFSWPLLYLLMWQQAQAIGALMNQIQQAQWHNGALPMPFISPLDSPMMQSTMPQQAPMDLMDIWSDSMQKAIRFKNYWDMIRKL